MFVVGVISVSENKTIILLYVIYHVHPYNWRWNFSSKVITSNDTFFFPFSFFLSFLSFFFFSSSFCLPSPSGDRRQPRADVDYWKTAAGKKFSPPGTRSSSFRSCNNVPVFYEEGRRIRNGLIEKIKCM